MQLRRYAVRIFSDLPVIVASNALSLVRTGYWLCRRHGTECEHSRARAHLSKGANAVNSTKGIRVGCCSLARCVTLVSIMTSPLG